MEVLQLDVDNMSDSMGKNRQHYQPSSSNSLDFEEITSLDNSLDSARIKSFKMSPQCSDDLSKTWRPQRREETWMETIRDYGTNLKYGYDLLQQSFCVREDPNKLKVYLLGKEYSSNNKKDEQDQSVEKVFAEIIWFSYRKNFPKLNYKESASDGSYVSDTGWGCMIRACQMMFAECLRKVLNEERGEEGSKESGKRLSFLNKLENIPREISKSSRKESASRNNRNSKQIISWFLDCEIDPNSSPYSIQNICSTLYKKFQLKPGNWFKASNVLFSLQEIHETYGKHTLPNIKLEVFPEGTMYISQALKKVTNGGLVTTNSMVDFEKGFEVIEEEEDEICVPASPRSCEKKEKKNGKEKQNNKEKEEEEDEVEEQVSIEETKTDGGENSNEIDNLMKLKWHSNLAVFIMAKIGLEKPNPEYFPFIKELLSYPESIGMIAGKPGLASYVAGFMEDKFMILDPHFVQEAVQNKKNLREHLHTYHCSIKYVSFDDIDTSVAFGFFLRNETEFQDFIRRFRASCGKKESFLSVVDNLPQEDVLEVENFDEEGEFEMISLK